MRHPGLLFALLYFLISACAPDAEEPPKAEQLIANAIEAHGSERLENGRLQFDFREKTYIADRSNGQFELERRYTDTSGRSIVDRLTNEGFERTVDRKVDLLKPKKIKAYREAVNSVHYFIALPLGLKHEAVQPTYIGDATINDRDYHKLKVTFREEGGGEDHQDEYVYWIQKDSNYVDFLAYNYVVNGGGARFREAINPRERGGVRFSDYINYKPVPDRRDVAVFDSLYQAGALKEVSRIINNDVRFTQHE